MNTVLFKIQSFSLSLDMCKMGANFWLQSGLKFLCSVWPCDQRPKRRMLDAVYDFQTLHSVFENCDF